MNVYLPVGADSATVETTRRALEAQDYRVNSVLVYAEQTGNQYADIFDAAPSDDLDMAYGIVDAVLAEQE